MRYIILLAVSCAGFPGLAQITFFADTTSGCDSLLVTFTYRNTDFLDTVSTVVWDFGNGLTGTGKQDQSVLYDSAGTYSVSILINGNTTVTREDYIRVHATPRARFFWSDSLELGTYTVVFYALPQPVDTVQYDYLWTFQDGGTGDTPVLIHRFPEAGEYTASLQVSHPEGCRMSRTEYITVRDSLDCPNVFTPNEDGINDYFIVNSNGVTLYSMEIFSRSGVLVYRSEAPILIWDGRNLSGQKLMPGVYYYIIRPANGSGRFEKKGFIELFR